MELARRNNRAVLLVELRAALVNVLTAAGITARTVAHQFRHTRRGPRGPKRRTGGSRNQPCSCNRSSSCRHSWFFRPPLARFHSNNSQIVQEISALVHALRPTFVMQFRSFYN